VKRVTENIPVHEITKPLKGGWSDYGFLIAWTISMISCRYLLFYTENLSMSGICDAAFNLMSWCTLVGIAACALNFFASLCNPSWRKFKSPRKLLGAFMLMLSSLCICQAIQANAELSVVKRAKPIIDAIARYRHDVGKSPSSLEALIPRYLSRIPGTGAPNAPDFFYELRPANAHDNGEHFWTLRVRGIGMSKDIFQCPVAKEDDSIWNARGFIRVPI
jgi:hypothetical protein